MSVWMVVLGIFAFLVFNLIIIVHELGHMLSAKKFGIKVNEFAIGMGPKIFKFRKGETLYSIRAFPIGGFCDLEGMEDEGTNSEFKNSFNQKKVWQRMVVIAAGAILNVILGFFMVMILLVQQPRFNSTTISEFKSGSVSDQYGLMPGDTIYSVNGFRTNNYKDMLFSLTVNQSDTHDFIVVRNGEKLASQNVRFNVRNENGQQSLQIDFTLKPIEKNFWTILTQSYYSTVSEIRFVWSSLIKIVMGKVSVKQLSGPIGTASIVGELTAQGLEIDVVNAINQILRIMAMITINLGIFNLLPFPALDGGRLMFLLFEMIFRKPINRKYEGWIHAVGFFLIISLTVLVAYNDVLKLIKR